MAHIEQAAWRPLLEGLLDPAFTLDGRLMVVDFNVAAHKLLGLEASRPLIHFSRSPELMSAIDQALATREPQTCELSLIVPMDQMHRVRVTPIAQSNQMGQPVLLVVLRDTTEELHLAQMRSDFVANASHELRTPLASLAGFVETLRGAAKDDPAARDKFLVIMHEQARRMSRLIEDLLSLSRVEMREHVAPSDRVELAAVVDEVARTLKPLAAQSGIEIAVDRGAGATQVVGDRDELAQVIQNLLQNAIKYGRSGGRVDVRLSTEGSRVLMQVIDNGIGIAPEHLPRLTERFYRVNAKDSRDRGGTGLGLAIVKHIVNRHRGSLRIESTKGVGSTFSVLLPSR